MDDVKEKHSSKREEIREQEKHSPNREMHITNRDFCLSISNMDTSIIPEGFQYCLEAFKVRNEPLGHNMTLALKLGWRPVEREAHPEFGLPDELEALLMEGELKHNNKFIIDRHRMLMRIPMHKYHEILQSYQNRSMEQRNVMAYGQNFKNDPYGTYIGQGASFKDMYGYGGDLNRRFAYESGSPLNVPHVFKQGSKSNHSNVFGQ